MLSESRDTKNILMNKDAVRCGYLVRIKEWDGAWGIGTENFRTINMVYQRHFLFYIIWLKSGSLYTKRNIFNGDLL